MTIRRAHSLLQIRSVSDSGDERIIEGIATTPEVDSYGDIVEPLGAEFELPMPLLWQHMHDKPVGHVEFAAPQKDGIPFKARIFSLEEPGKLKDRLDEAWQSVKLGLVRAVSIGFQPKEWSQLRDGGYRFDKWKWVELSLVTIPANSEATIDVVRSADRAALTAALGKVTKSQGRIVSLLPAGASASSFPIKKQDISTMTLKQQLEAAEAKRAANQARLQAILKSASEDGGRTLNDSEAEEFDGLEADNTALDAQIRRLGVALKSAEATAVPVAGATQAAASASRGGAVSVRSALPKGAAFTRMCMALAATKGDLHGAAAFAEARYKDSSPEVVTVLKAAVAAGTTSDPAWAGNLVEYTHMTSEFIELLRPLTVVDRLTQVRRVPFRVKVPAQSTASTAGWVGEARPKPVSNPTFGMVQLDEHKVAAIAVISQELARSSAPSALDLVQSDLVKAVAQEIDLQFLDPARAGVAGVSPQSITNGALAIPASGTNAAALRADIQALMNAFLDANRGVTDLTFVMSPGQALAFSLMLNPLGQPEFPGLTAAGGTFFGLPVIVSNNVPTDTSGSVIVLMAQSEIMLADDGTATVDVNTSAAVQMNSTPDYPATASTVFTSLWQQNLIGIRVERFVTWVRGRPGAVAYISGANYRA